MKNENELKMILDISSNLECYEIILSYLEIGFLILYVQNIS